MDFTIKIADVPVKINCRYPQNKQFFKNYLSDEAPRVTVFPTEFDYYTMEERLRIQAANDDSIDKSRIPFLVENSVLHALLSEELISYNVLLVHGSAIVVDGETFLFMANSGTGKSTHTRLWREHFRERAWMINDDKPMLKVTESGIIAYGTPWDGKHHLSYNSSAPVRAIAKLSRGDSNYIQLMSKADAMTLIYRYGVRPNWPEQIAKALQLEEQIVRKVDVYHLHCNMDKEAVLVAYRGMTEGRN